MKHALIAIVALVLISTASNADTAHVQVSGAYTVPVGDPSLKPYAIFPVTINSEYIEGQMPTSIEFTLPKELVGETPPHFVFAQDPVTKQWAGKSDLGEEVKGDCTLNAKVFGCNVKFAALKTDLSAVDQFLGKQVLSNPVELKNRIAVAHAFSGEPEGIFEYLLVVEKAGE